MGAVASPMWYRSSLRDGWMARGKIDEGDPAEAVAAPRWFRPSPRDGWIRRESDEVDVAEAVAAPK